MNIVTQGDEETQQAGFNFAREILPGDVICLYGNLGAGKTTFVKGLAKGLGVTSRIISPTFVIVREHRITSKSNIGKLYHLDLYRLENSHDVNGIDLQGILSDDSGVVVIEWPEVAASSLVQKKWDIKITQEKDNKRTIVISKYG